MVVDPLDLVLVALAAVVALSLATLALCGVVIAYLAWTGTRRALRALERLERAADQATGMVRAALHGTCDGTRAAAWLLEGARCAGPLLRGAWRVVRARAPLALLLGAAAYLLGTKPRDR